MLVSPSDISTLSAFSHHASAACRDHAAIILSLLASVHSNAKHILSSSGAQGLLTASLEGSSAVRPLAETALQNLAPPLFGAYLDDMRGSLLLSEHLFWTDTVIDFLSPKMQAVYPNLVVAPDNFFIELFHLCALRLLRSAACDTEDVQEEDDVRLRKAQRSMREVFEVFDNEPAALGFFSGIFHFIAKRRRESLADFDKFNVAHLPDLARLGVEVLNRVSDMPLARNALMSLYERYLKDDPPTQWRHLFKEATKTAYCLKYMFRESLPKAKAKFFEHLDNNLSGQPRELFSHLVRGAFEMYDGLVDQETLATTDFLTNPQALLKVVREGVADKDERVQLLGEIAARYMQTYIDCDPPKLPLTPHHTQVAAMLMFSQFFEQRERWMEEYGQRSIILQMKTGEGKSIVIAMMAIYTVKQLGRRVHVLENNEGLLERDFNTYEPFYKQFGLSCSKSIDATSDICYCLKRQNNAYFNAHMLNGDLDLSETVLIVDEVDDLVVNEKPTLLYTKPDAILTPQYKACYLALIKGSEQPPAGADSTIWDDCKRIKRESDAKVEGVDYLRADKGWAMLETGPDGTPRAPKVPLTDDWLVYKNFKDFGLEPSKDTFCNCLCTPYMYNKYACIFGLTGSVGGEAERAYIQKTYQSVPYEVPQFLHTCENTIKEEATNLGVTIEATSQQMIANVVAMAKKYYHDTPVLVITRGAESNELSNVYKALAAAIPERNAVQRMTERNDEGELMIDQCEAIVERATKRCYSEQREVYFRITVTDWFGGRGHDFDCMDERANAAGGMLVIATSIPDAREWTQWKGRTARQDRPGQYAVVLSEQEEPFKQKFLSAAARFRNPGVASAFSQWKADTKEIMREKGLVRLGLADGLRLKSPDDIIETLLLRKDEAIHDSLLRFEADQARGAWQNELCETYYRQRARGSEVCWPSLEWRKTDVRLRDMLRVPFGTGAKIQDAASSRLGVTVQGPPPEWGWSPEDAFGIEAKRKKMAVIFLIDRTYESFLQSVVDAVLKVYNTHLLEDDLVGYYGLGDGWIFETQVKGENEEQLRQKIIGSVEKKGDPHVYSSMDKCVDYLADVSDDYSKWLVVLTDTADFQCANEKGAFDKGAPARATAAAEALLVKLQAMQGMNLVLIDASEIGNFNRKHTMWPTWRTLSKRLTNEVGEANTGLNIQAAEESQIDEAFDKVAGAMSGGASA